jgi:hypothetical protein
LTSTAVPTVPMTAAAAIGAIQRRPGRLGEATPGVVPIGPAVVGDPVVVVVREWMCAVMVLLL